MIATLVLLVTAIASFEAISRSSTPRQVRRPLRELSAGEHLAAAWAGLVLLTDLHTRGRALLEAPLPNRRRALPMRSRWPLGSARPDERGRPSTVQR